MRQPARRLADAAQWFSVLALALATVAVAACDRPSRNSDGEYRPVVSFDTATSTRRRNVSDAVMMRTVAERDDQRAYGLMERVQLDDDAGMVFLYSREQPAENGFWMWRTRIALDIAFFDADGGIVAILSMDPCPHADPRGCPSYPPGVPYHGALEVNRGTFARHGITTGDRIVLER